MKFFADSDETQEVTWYFVDDDRPTIPYLSPFRAKLWDRDIPHHLGEVNGTQSYYRGTDLWGLNGEHHCGDPSVWTNGATAATPLPPLDPNTGQPVCCGAGQPIVFRGGQLGGGHFLLTIPYRATGGSFAGGSLVVTGPQEIVFSGGSLAGGTAFVEGSQEIAFSGGSLAGGTAFVDGPQEIAFSVGSLAGGTTVTIGPLVYSFAGGSTADGPTAVQRAAEIAMMGGALAGGNATVESPVDASFAGGGLAGGCVRVELPGNFSSSGGSLSGGAFAVIPSPIIIMRGGQGAGGNVAVIPSPIISNSGGGLSGGRVDVFVDDTIRFTGGSYAGGNVSVVIPEVIVFEGGNMQGGGFNVSFAVPTDCCDDNVATVLKLSIGITSPPCDCLPSDILFTWNGSVWQGETTSNTCGGLNTADWFITCDPLGPVWFLDDGDAQHIINVNSCSPFDGQVVVSNPSYCTGGNWTGTLTDGP